MKRRLIRKGRIDASAVAAEVDDEIIAQVRGTAPAGETLGTLRGDIHMTPKHFGVTDSSTASENVTAINAFFDYVAANPSGLYDWTCTASIDGPIVATGIDNTRIDGFMDLSVESAVTDAFTFSDCYYSDFGSLSVVGSSSTAYTSRLITNGIVLKGFSRSSLARATAERVKRYSVVVDSSIENNNMAKLGIVKTAWVGVCDFADDAHNYSANYSNATRIGSDGSSAQTTTITVDDLPTELEAGDFIKIDANYHRVISISGLDITMFKWIAGDPVSGTLEYVFGGGVLSVGSNSNVVQYDLIDVSVSGIGLKDVSLFGSTVASLVTQRCSIGLQIGKATGTAPSAANGTVIGSLYTEANGADIVSDTLSPQATVISNCLNINRDKIVNAATPIRNEVLNPSLSKIVGLSYSIDSVTYKAQAQIPEKKNVYGLELKIGPPDVSQSTIYGNIVTVDLKSDQKLYELHGYTECRLYVVGGSASEGPTGDVTFQIHSDDSATHDIEGAAAKVFPVKTGPQEFICTLFGTEWIVTDAQTTSIDTTANRPLSPATGQQHFDTTLGQPIWYDGTNWVDSAGTTV